MSKTKKLLAGVDRKAQISEAGAKLAAKYGAVNVTRRMVAAAAKVSEALVSAHMGPNVDAQKAYRRTLKKLGGSEPDKATIEAQGFALRKHKPRDARDARPRTETEKTAIKRKAKKETAKRSPVAKKATVAKKSAPAKKATAVCTKATRTAETKPIKSPGKPATPKEQKVVTTPAKAQQSPAVRKTAARKPMAPPPALPTLPLPGALPLPE